MTKHLDIDTKAMRAKILDLAIRGKLTDQRQEDGNARDLLKEIQAEKERLIKEKKIKKEKPLSEITEEEKPFDIPENWEWVRLGDICSKVVDGDHNPPKGSNRPTPYIMVSSQNINNDRLVNLCRVRYLSKEVFEKENLRTLASEGDIFFTSVGSLGRSCIYDGSLNICFQRSVSVITAQIYNWYLKRCLDSPYFQNMIYAEAKGTAQKGFYLKQLSNSLIPLPPLNEQHRIADKVSTFFAQLDAIDKAYEEYRELQQAMKAKLLDLAIQGKLTDQREEDGNAQDLLKEIQAEKEKLIKEKKIKKEKPLLEIEADEIPFAIPNNWKWVRFGDIANYRKGPFGSSLTKAMFVPKSNNTVKVYEQKNAIQKDASLGNYYISYDYYKQSMQSFTVSPGDIIVSCAGTIGEAYILPSDIEVGIINQALMRVRNYQGIKKDYFLICFSYAITHGAHKGQGTAIKNIPPFSILKKMMFPLPPLAEQKRIVAKLDELLPHLNPGKEP